MIGTLTLNSSASFAYRLKSRVQRTYCRQSYMNFLTCLHLFSQVHITKYKWRTFIALYYTAPHPKLLVVRKNLQSRMNNNGHIPQRQQMAVFLNYRQYVNRYLFLVYVKINVTIFYKLAHQSSFLNRVLFSARNGQCLFISPIIGVEKNLATPS